MQTNESAYLLCIAFVIMGIIFILLTLNSLLCIVRAFKCNYFFPKIFYIFMLITCIDQATYQIYYLVGVLTTINNDSDDNTDTESLRTIFFQTIYIPDAIFFIVYFSLFWQFLIMMYNGRIQTGNILVGKKDWNPESANHIVRKILYVYIIGQSIVIWLFLVGKVSPKAVMVSDICVNASIPIIIVIMIFYLNVKFSGSPFVSNRYEKSNYKIQQLLTLWIILRIPQLVVNALLIVYDDTVLKLFSGQLEASLIEQLFLVFFVVGDIIIVQIIPLLMAMTNDFLRALLQDHNRQQIHFNGSLETALRPDSYIPQIKQKLLDFQQFQSLKLDDLIIDQKISFKRFNGFGEIKIATLKNNKQNYALRIIEFKELSSFLIDETEQEIDKINSIKKGYKILWLKIIESKLYILTKYYENLSLHHLIHSDNKFIYPIKTITTNSQYNKTQLMKIRIALDLIIRIKELHDQNIILGNLNSNNILFTKSYNIKIVDYGLRAIKKYSGLVNGYSNKNGYTAPECLIDRGNVISQSITIESDIYSYGMILYHLFTETIPFNNIPHKDIYILIKDQQNRPKIPQNINSNITTLIRFCWQQEPDKRPKSNDIITTLKQILETFE